MATIGAADSSVRLTRSLQPREIAPRRAAGRLGPLLQRVSHACRRVPAGRSCALQGAEGEADPDRPADAEGRRIGSRRCREESLAFRGVLRRLVEDTRLREWRSERRPLHGSSGRVCTITRRPHLAGTPRCQWSVDCDLISPDPATQSLLLDRFIVPKPTANRRTEE